MKAEKRLFLAGATEFFLLSIVLVTLGLAAWFESGGGYLYTLAKILAGCAVIIFAAATVVLCISSFDVLSRQPDEVLAHRPGEENRECVYRERMDGGVIYEKPARISEPTFEVLLKQGELSAGRREGVSSSATRWMDRMPDHLEIWEGGPLADIFHEEEDNGHGEAI